MRTVIDPRACTRAVAMQDQRLDFAVDLRFGAGKTAIGDVAEHRQHVHVTGCVRVVWIV
jgi:hypothetical protein